MWRGVRAETSAMRSYGSDNLTNTPPKKIIEDKSGKML
jgi:hypothetical protein